MAAVGKEESVRSICRKGYGDALGRGRAHRYFNYMVNGVPVATTYVSHGGSKDLSENLIHEMAKDCHLSRKEFIAFARCEMSADDYRAILLRKGIISE
jgi:hypothetical protein